MSLRRAQPQVLMFLAVSSAGVPLTGIAFADSEVLLSKDGNAFIGLLGNRIIEVGLGYYKVVLTSVETNAGFLALAVRRSGVAVIVADVFGTTSEQTTALVAAGSNSASSFVTNLTDTLADAHRGKYVRFDPPSALAPQIGKVSAYDGTTKRLDFVEPFTSAPAIGDVFTIVDN